MNIFCDLAGSIGIEIHGWVTLDRLSYVEVWYFVSQKDMKPPKKHFDST